MKIVLNVGAESISARKYASARKNNARADMESANNKRADMESAPTGNMGIK